MPQIRKWAPKILPCSRQGRDGALGRRSRARRVRQISVRPDAHARASATPTGRASSASCRLAGYVGTIDIEGWHDPVYRDELEMTGQVRALNYLKQCRGGDALRSPIQPEARATFDRRPRDTGRRINGVKPNSKQGGSKMKRCLISGWRGSTALALACAALIGAAGAADAAALARQMVQQGAPALLRRRRRGRRLRHDRLQRRAPGRRTTPARRSTTSSPAGPTKR